MEGSLILAQKKIHHFFLSSLRELILAWGGEGGGKKTPNVFSSKVG
jgi:hypothetical protein